MSTTYNVTTSPKSPEVSHLGTIIDHYLSLNCDDDNLAQGLADLMMTISILLSLYEMSKDDAVELLDDPFPTAERFVEGVSDQTGKSCHRLRAPLRGLRSRSRGSPHENPEMTLREPYSGIQR